VDVVRWVRGELESKSLSGVCSDRCVLVSARSLKVLLLVSSLKFFLHVRNEYSTDVLLNPIVVQTYYHTRATMTHIKSEQGKRGEEEKRRGEEARENGSYLWTTERFLPSMLVANVMFEIITSLKYSFLSLATPPITHISTSFLPSIGNLLIFDVLIDVLTELFN
jgi:hypothetical protein